MTLPVSLISSRLFAAGTDILFLAQDKPAAQAQPSPIPLMIPGLVFFLVLYYLMFIRPQQNEQKRLASVREGLKKGDNVITVGGIVGTISHLDPKGKLVTLRMDDGSKVKMLRTAIQTYLNPDQEPPASETGSATESDSDAGDRD